MAIQDADFQEQLRLLRRDPGLWLSLGEAQRDELKRRAMETERGETGGSREDPMGI